jgi:FAD/FMN-containing dehydrogenase
VAGLKPYGTRVYVNNIGRGEGRGRPVRERLRNYQRLAELKKKYDPENLFRHNQNIKPAV